jgi:ABC-2 type transport system permease protein
MTTLTTTASASTIPSPLHDELTRSRLSAGGILRSEWVKLRSLRSNYAVLGFSAVALIAVGAIFSGFVGGVFSNTEEASQFAHNPAGASLQGTMIAQLIIGVLGILSITGEYTTGTIRTTFTMVPQRLPVLAAKTVVVAAVTFVTMLVSTLAVFFLGQAIIGAGTVPAASLNQVGVLRAVVGTAGYLTGIAVLGLAIGTLLRSTAGSISTLVALVFLLPGLGQLLLPTRWSTHVLKYLPSNAGEAFTSVHTTPDLLTPTTGLWVFLAWVVVPLLAAAVVLRRRAT